MAQFTLLGTQNAKTVKGEGEGFKTFILYLAPGVSAGCGNTCPAASAGCLAACLNKSGRSIAFPKIEAARIRKTRAFFQAREWFMSELASDIEKAIAYCTRHNLTPAIRLNGTSDIVWEKIAVNGARNIFELFPMVQFYDYTKIPNRKVNAIKNYHLTFSRSENNEKQVKQAIDNGMNIAVVFNKLPESYYGLPVHNGDITDLRFTDPSQCIVGLKAKGYAKTDNSGFTIR